MLLLNQLAIQLLAAKLYVSYGVACCYCCSMVCLSVCWSQALAVLKRQNPSRFHFRTLTCGAQ